jgi:hypothetical protein
MSTHDEIRYRVRVKLTAANGNFVGVGIGEASTNEEKFMWRKAVCKEEFEATPEDRKRVKWSKGANGAYSQDQVRTNISDLANTVLKMAKKRAQIDAILTATAASDIFTQDIEDLPEEIRDEMAGDQEPINKKPHVEPPKQKQTPPPSSSGETISEPQGKRLFAIAMGAGMKDPDTFRVWLKEQYGYDSSKHILKAQYDEICTAAKEYSSKEKESE